jgi:hypothetical protein
MTDMTVLEFAVKHADECTCGVEDRVAHISTDVNGLMEAASAHGKVLWEVVVAEDGRASLLWIAYPEPVWGALLIEAMKLLALKKLLGMTP